jgi:hypothetical protein
LVVVDGRLTLSDAAEVGAVIDADPLPLGGMVVTHSATSTRARG